MKLVGNTKRYKMSSNEYNFALKSMTTYGERQAAQIIEPTKVGFSGTIILTESEKKEIRQFQNKKSGK